MWVFHRWVKCRRQILLCVSTNDKKWQHFRGSRKNGFHEMEFWKQHNTICKKAEVENRMASTNIIENLWIDLKRAVHAIRPKNLTKLEDFCIEEWMKIPQHELKDSRLASKNFYKLWYLPKGLLLGTNHAGCPKFCFRPIPFFVILKIRFEKMFLFKIQGNWGSFPPQLV